MDQRTLPFDKDDVARRRRCLGSLHDKVFGCSGGEVRDDFINGYTPSGNHDPRLAGGYEHGSMTPAAEHRIDFQCGRHLADVAITSDGQDDSGRQGMGAGVSNPVAVGCASCVPDSHAALGRDRRQFVVVVQERVQPVDDI